MRCGETADCRQMAGLSGPKTKSEAGSALEDSWTGTVERGHPCRFCERNDPLKGLIHPLRHARRQAAPCRKGPIARRNPAIAGGGNGADFRSWILPRQVAAQESAPFVPSWRAPQEEPKPGRFLAPGKRVRSRSRRGGGAL
jgi:hypothetical protein